VGLSGFRRTAGSADASTASADQRGPSANKSVSSTSVGATRITDQQPGIGRRDDQLDLGLFYRGGLRAADPNKTVVPRSWRLAPAPSTPPNPSPRPRRVAASGHLDGARQTRRTESSLRRPPDRHRTAGAPVGTNLARAQSTTGLPKRLAGRTSAGTQTRSTATRAPMGEREANAFPQRFAVGLGASDCREPRWC